MKGEPNRTNQIHLSLSFFTFLPRYPTFPTSTCCSSLVSMVFEDALAGLPSLGQTKVRLPRRGPSWVGVRWILVGLPRRDRSDWSTIPVGPVGAAALQGASLLVAQSCAFVCWPRIGANNISLPFLHLVTRAPKMKRSIPAPQTPQCARGHRRHIHYYNLRCERYQSRFLHLFYC